MKKVTLLLLLSVVVFGCSMQKGGQDREALMEAQGLYAEAMKYHEERDWDKVMELCREAVLLYPEYTEAHREIIDHEQDKEKLVAEYEALAVSNPESAPFMYLLGRAYKDRDKREEAFSKAVELDPNYVWGYLGMAYIYGQKGMKEEARKAYEKMIELDPRNKYGHQQLGKLLMDEEDYTGAEVAFKQMKTDIPDEMEGYLALGSLYEKELENPEDARAVYMQAEERFVSNSTNAETARWLYVNTFEGAEKVRQMEEFLKTYPSGSNYVKAYRAIFDHYKKEDAVKAERIAREALSVPETVKERSLRRHAYMTLFNIAIESGDKEKESALTEEVLNSGYVDTYLYSYLGKHYDKEGGDTELALRCFEKALEMATPENMQGTLLFGAVGEEGLKSWAKYYSTSSMIDLGGIYIKSLEYDKAVKILEQALGGDDFLDPDVTYKLGIAYNKNGQREKAVEVFLTSLITYQDLRVRKEIVDAYSGLHGSTKGLAELIISSVELADTALSSTPANFAASMDLNDAIIYVRNLKAEDTPEFSVASFAGDEYTNENLAGKVVVVDFWGSWCGPCRLELPHYQEAMTKYNGNDAVVFLAVSNDPTDKIVEDFMSENGYTFTVARNPDFHESFGIGAWPTLMIIGKNGKIMYEQIGFNSDRDFVGNLSNEIDLLLTAE